MSIPLVVSPDWKGPSLGSRQAHKLCFFFFIKKKKKKKKAEKDGCSPLQLNLKIIYLAFRLEG